VEALLGACAGYAEPAVQEAVFRLALRLQSPQLFEIALQVLPDRVDERLRDRTLALVLVAARQDHPGFTVRDLLTALARRWPDHYEPALRRRLVDGLDGIRDVAELAYRTGSTLPLEVWVPLLARKEKAVLWHGVGYTHPLERLRVSDLAALQVTKLRPELPFDEAGDEAARDAQISAMRKALVGAGK